MQNTFNHSVYAMLLRNGRPGKAQEYINRFRGKGEPMPGVALVDDQHNRIKKMREWLSTQKVRTFDNYKDSTIERMFIERGGSLDNI